METLIDLSKAFGWLAAIFVNLLIAWIVWSLHKKFMNRDDCEANRKADKKERERFIQLLTTHEQAVRELNLRVDQMPHGLDVRLERMDGEQKRMARGGQRPARHNGTRGAAGGPAVPRAHEGLNHERYAGHHQQEPPSGHPCAF